MADTEPTPPNALSTETIEAVGAFDESELRAVIDFAQQRHEAVQSDITDMVRARPDEEIVRIERKDVYTFAVKQQLCGGYCSDCPHGPFLYYVREETDIRGETDLRWRYLGTVHQE